MLYPQEQHRMASKTLSTTLRDKVATHIIGYVKLSQYQQGVGPFK